MTEWSNFDSLLVAIVFVSVVFSFLKGFTRELVSLAALVWGFLLAAWFYPPLAGTLLRWSRNEEVAAVTAFLIIFLLVIVLGGFLSRAAGKLVDKAGLRWFDRMLGGVLGLIRGLLVDVIVVVVLAVFSAGLLAQSRLAPYLLEGARLAVSVAPEDMRERFDSGLDRMRRGSAPRRKT